METSVICTLPTQNVLICFIPRNVSRHYIYRTTCGKVGKDEMSLTAWSKWVRSSCMESRVRPWHLRQPMSQCSFLRDAESDGSLLGSWGLTWRRDINTLIHSNIMRFNAVGYSQVEAWAGSCPAAALARLAAPPVFLSREANPVPGGGLCYILSLAPLLLFLPNLHTSSLHGSQSARGLPPPAFCSLQLNINGENKTHHLYPH